MEIILQLGAVLVLLFLLIQSAKLIEHSLVALSIKLHVNPFVTGFVVLGVASSLPEISIAINSSVQAVPDLSVGNLFAASVFLLTFVLGALAVKRKSIQFRGIFGRKEVLISMVVIVLQVALIADGHLSYSDGVVLIASYVIFAGYIVFRSRRQVSKKTTVILTDQSFIISILKAVVGGAMLVILSSIIVQIASDLAVELQVSGTIIGITLLGIGTNLPELTIMLTSHGSKENSLAAGDIIGSAVMNAPTLGLIGILLPHNVEDMASLTPVLVVLVIVSVLFGYFAWTDHKLSRIEGAIMVLIFVVIAVLHTSLAFA